MKFVFIFAKLAELPPGVMTHCNAKRRGPGHFGLLQLNCPDLALERHITFKNRPDQEFQSFAERVFEAHARRTARVSSRPVYVLRELVNLLRHRGIVLPRRTFEERAPNVATRWRTRYCAAPRIRLRSASNPVSRFSANKGSR